MIQSRKRGAVAALAVAGLILSGTAALAQGPAGEAVTSIDSPYPYKTSQEHFEALKRAANGGTRHTAASLPDWSGYWSTDVSRGVIQINGRNVRDKTLLMSALTPPYQAIYKKRLEDQAAGNEWDPLSYCLPPGFPRWYSEYGLREFVVRPEKVWLISEMMNEVRRVYTDGRGHTPDEQAFPLWLGDSIGFWNGDTLVIHTTQLKENILQRQMPAHSDKIETVETWKREGDLMVVDVTLYDSEAFTKPWHSVQQFTKVTDPDLRSRYWACAENNNIVREDDGGTGMILPGDPGFKDPTDVQSWTGGAPPAAQ